MGNDHAGPWERLGEYVTELMVKKEVPGVAVGILHDGDVHAAGFGVTNVDHPLRVTAGTLFQIGSITKTFTGTLTMRLVDQGKVDLDAPVRTYIPGFQVADAEASQQATVRHLLTHTSGWAGDFFHDTGGGDDALARYVGDMTNLEQLAPVGTVWSYNNAGFSLLGRIIEVVTGVPYDEALKAWVLDPIGLAHSFLDHGDVMTRGFATGHNMGEAGPVVARPWPLGRFLAPAGGVACSVEDLLRYARFHLGDGSSAQGERLLSPESMREMQSPQASKWGESEQMGLTWHLEDVGGIRQIWHNGGTVGQRSQLALIPARNFAVAVLTNAIRGAEIARGVSRWCIREYLGVEVRAPRPIDVSSEDLAAYAGRYRRPFAEIEVGLLGGRLVGQVTPRQGFPNEDVPAARPTPPASLGLCEPDRLLVLDGPMSGTRGEVIRRGDGSIGWLRLGARIHKREG